MQKQEIIFIYFLQKEQPRKTKSHLVITECEGYIFGSCFCGDFSNKIVISNLDARERGISVECKDRMSQI